MPNEGNEEIIEVILVKFRGQAAMEFLMTYGWAILIMLVVIAVLFYLGVFNVGGIMPRSCIFPAGFTCYDYSMDHDGNATLDLGQATGHDITITGVACTTNGTAPSATESVTNVSITSGHHAALATIECTPTCASGDACKATILLNYTYGTTTKTVSGEISYPIPKQ